MLLNPKVDFSKNEFDSYKKALSQGIRPDGRDLNEPRKLIIQKITTPGVATVHLGNTVVSAVTTARLVTPSQNSPSKGMHNIYLFADSLSSRGQLSTMNDYFKMVWAGSHVLEEESLCVKVGEKVWQLVSRVIVHDDDSGFIEAAFAALVASLATLRFPAFDANTGILFQPTNHRTHKIAFDSKPICIIFGYTDIDGKTISIMDPTRIEQLITPRFTMFIFDQNLEQIYLDCNLPANGEKHWEDYNRARDIAKEWRSILFKAIDDFDPESYSVGSPQDFAGYEPKKVILPRSGEIKQYSEIEIWRGETTAKYIIDMSLPFEATQETESKESQKTTAKGKESQDWLFSSLMC